MTFDPLNPPPVAPGNVCYPGEISDADAATATAQQLVCQLSMAASDTATTTIPGSFQNAQAGDAILSPAPVEGGDLIAAMFAALTPAQHHGHSGIMTTNFFELTHCTASVDRISKNVNKDFAGIPTSLPTDMLQYAWPGSLTQSIDDATNSVSLFDPGGTAYSFLSFNTAALGDGFEIIYPLVVKPLPENELAARPSLRQAADTARSKGARYDTGGHLVSPGGCYYSFFSYTNPARAEGFTQPAGADAGWAQGLVPNVCSSFVWMSLKANGLGLVSSSPTETLSDFTPQAIAGGAQVGPATPDGLIFYPQAERQQGAAALYQMFMDQALNQEMGLGTIPGINSAIAGPIADQLLNDFAFGNPNMVGDSSWQTPGDGNAVSPDNILWWNPPEYGFAEPIQYLPTHPEQYTTSRWVQIITWGNITGKVFDSSGNPVSGAHVWVYLPGGDAFSGPDGSYTLSHIPIGSYNLRATAVVTVDGFSDGVDNGLNGQVVTLTTGNPNVTQNITLQGLPQAYRRLDMQYSLSCDHGDGNPFNTHGVENAGPFTFSIDVNPGNTTGSHTYTFDYAGGGYFQIAFEFDIALVFDLSISVTVTGRMTNAGDSSPSDTYTVGPYYVPMGNWLSGGMTMEHSDVGYHNGPANFTFVVTNNQQTGA